VLVQLWMLLFIDEFASDYDPVISQRGNNLICLLWVGIHIEQITDDLNVLNIKKEIFCNPSISKL